MPQAGAESVTKMYLENFSEQSKALMILAHGAGAPMDSPFMEDFTKRLVGKGISVVRFEFPYMGERRTLNRKRPPDRQPVLLECWRQMVSRYAHVQPLFIGGKSMGGRMATILAAEDLPIKGVVALAYPFHPPGKPDRLRIDHLGQMRCPALVVQGERDPFGRPEEVAYYELPSFLQVQWIPQGDHDLQPPKRSGLSYGENLDLAVASVNGFVDRCIAGESE